MLAGDGWTLWCSGHLFHGPCLALAVAAGEPVWPQEQQEDGLAGYQQHICDFRDLENGCCLNVAWRWSFLCRGCFVMCLWMTSSRASDMSSWKVILQSGGGGKLLSWSWEREGNRDRGVSHCQELAKRSRPGSTYKQKCSQNQLLLWQENMAQGCAPELSWFLPIVLGEARRFTLLNHFSSGWRSSYHVLG